ncbi:uncharacterized protein N7503_011537 [Penicillium pulvis]|uniref:uncharacterized protein n=1 Tax=Penicillium pulvis TaxID=1562058 RepID=UPI0025483EC1|nr:uncharacterized protein N7503_011537 [Penicillium pulvis]KAJ5786325.1 hypothetical protein N7503_011537 [Penicillium pulvis]
MRKRAQKKSAVVTRRKAARPKNGSHVQSYTNALTRSQTTKAKRIMDAALNPTHTEPEPFEDTRLHSSPPAWAETRQSLCDAIPWFRALQGSTYQNNGTCYGILIDADCGSRFYLDDEIIITRVGGSYQKGHDGQLRLMQDQHLDRYPAKALLASLQKSTPVGMVIGNKNAQIGVGLPHRYNVLAYFRVTDIWYEGIDGHAGLKVRFEKVSLVEKSWWVASNTPDPLPYDQRPLIRSEVGRCIYCNTESPRVFQQGWMCLQKDCAHFWKIGIFDPPANLNYHSSWLNNRCNPQTTAIAPHEPLIPSTLASMTASNGIDATSRDTWRGIVCPRCKKCVQRVLWHGWKCTIDPPVEGPSERCTFEQTMQLRPVSIREVAGPRGRLPIEMGDRKGKNAIGQGIDLLSHLPYHKHTYEIPGIGSVTHFLANAGINERPGGPNDLFNILQKQPLGLKRFPLDTAVVTGMLTSHFAVNYGMPYKYVVSVASKGFNEAPDAILRCLGRLTWATEQAVTAAGGLILPPNELLALGYFEGMKIGFHDDGEKSLGPTIATLSLGASSTMKIRMKHQYYNGQSRRGVLLKKDIILPNCTNEKQRQKWKDQFENGTITKGVYDRRRTTLFRKQRLTGESPIQIQLDLQHGDLVVMHGEDLQKCYEHSVISSNLLRFALTARYIKPDCVNKAELPKGEFTLTPDQVYHGN